MNRDEQEMALWREAYCASRLRSRADRETVEILAGYGADADMAVAEFCRRYPSKTDSNSDPDTSSIRDLLEAITGDSAFTGFGDSLQSRIYAAVDALRNGRLVEPPAVWYDDPPFAGEYHVEGFPRVCWVEEGIVWAPTWSPSSERPIVRELPRNGLRVSPVTKPKEPKQ